MPGFADQLAAAANAHDAAAFASYFAEDYVSEQPAHPSRRFIGPAQVQANWTAFIRDVPDLAVEVVASAVSGDTEWIEWRWSGSRRDGSRFDIRGVMVLTIDGAQISAGRLYLEPVDDSPVGIDAAVSAWTAS